MAPQEPLAQSLSALSRFFVGDGTMQETLTRVAHFAEQALPATAMTGITMLVDGRAKTAVFTDEAAPEIDSAQYETGIGPCLDAFRYRKIVRIDDTTKDDQWAPSVRRRRRSGFAAPCRSRSWPTTKAWAP